MSVGRVYSSCSALQVLHSLPSGWVPAGAGMRRIRKGNESINQVAILHTGRAGFNPPSRAD